VGLWLLSEPVPDLASLDRVLRALATRVGGKYEPSAETLIRVPGTRHGGLLPTPTVEVIVWHPEQRYGADALACL
jgi:hypothetical protein